MFGLSAPIRWVICAVAWASRWFFPFDGVLRDEERTGHDVHVSFVNPDSANTDLSVAADRTHVVMISLTLIRLIMRKSNA